MSYTLGEAARATGKAKPTIAKAITSGRISAAKNDDGSYSIDPAELHRVYPMTGNANGELLSVGHPTATLGAATVEIEHWRVLAAEREETIRDLRARLDSEAEERRRLTALLTADRGPHTSIGPRRGWWYRLRNKAG
jgi:hypothetical protein